MASMENSAVSMLKQAVELDNKGGREEEAFTLYREGADMLMQVVKVTTDAAKKERMRKKIIEYVNRAEELKKHIDEQNEAGKYCEQIRITDNSVGHSYASLFERLIDESLMSVVVEDPYIRSNHQIYNFLRFCELLVKKSSLKKIHLITSQEESQSGREAQEEKLRKIGRSLQKHDVQLFVDYSSTLHDREIRFDTGWVIKIGRGLDIYKPTDNNFCIGFCDYDLRLCHETTVDIIHRKPGKEEATQ